MLAVHASWSLGAGDAMVLWAEDSSLEAVHGTSAAAAAGSVKRSGKAPPGASGAATARRVKRPARPRPESHPFAASLGQLAVALAGAGATVAGATAGALEDRAVVWLPGTRHTPLASPQLVREGDGTWAPPAGGEEATGLWPFEVPVLRLAAGPALDTVLALATYQSADLAPGASVKSFAALAGLALEVVAGGRVLPGLGAPSPGAGQGARSTARGAARAGPRRGEASVAQKGSQNASRYVARWSPVGGGRDEERLHLLSASLPAICRSLDQGPQLGGGGALGADPERLVREAFQAFVDAVCREALAGARRSVFGVALGATARRRPAPEAWLEALRAPGPLVDADAGELAKLERLVAEWRAGVAGRGGPWRLCFRVCEPKLVDEEPSGASDGGSGEAWRIELLLQASDDPSLVVEAGEVWRCGAELRRASRTVEAPHEVLLAELGRARWAYPELGEALRRAAPTELQVDLAGAYRFLTEVAPALEVAGFGVLLPAWWRHPSSRLGARLRARTARPHGGAGGGLLNGDGLLAFDWQAAIGEEKLGLGELEQLARLKAPLVRVRGRWLELRAGEAQKLAEFVRSGRRPGEGRTMSVAEALRAAAGVDEAVDGAPVLGFPVLGVEADGLLGALLRGELADRAEVTGTPAGFAGELRPYQQRAVAWMGLLERTGLGACLADDMGLGKTAMVLALVQAGRGAQGAKARGRGGPKAPGPTLVVCPTSVVGNWKREAEKFVPELKVTVHHGSGRARDAKFSEQIAGADIVITSYSLVDRDRAALGALRWSRVVLDEAQNVKNPEAKQTKAVRGLPATRRIALTGTPVENHLGELWSIMEILNPGLLGSAGAFRDNFAVPIERYREPEAAEKLRALTQPFILRRLKTDKSIISDLPEKMEMKVLCNLTREQATLYRAVVDEMLQKIDEAEGIERRGLVLATMLRLKQVCNHPAHYLGDGSALAGRSGKLERTVEILDEVLQSGERALVFSQYAEMGTMLRSHLAQRLSCQVGFLHGGLPRAQRDLLVARFQESDDIPVLVLSLKAGGTGLNLTAANHVVHFDRWWNPAVENQATDRAFRIGQHRNVQVRKLVCVGTLEDRIDQMIEAKRELAERVVGSGESWLTELTTDELADVLRLSSEALGAA